MADETNVVFNSGAAERVAFDLMNKIHPYEVGSPDMKTKKGILDLYQECLYLVRTGNQKKNQ